MRGILALAVALALGMACEQKSPDGSSVREERGGATSSPAARGPSGERASPQSVGAASALTGDPGTGGSGDAGLGADAGTRMR